MYVVHTNIFLDTKVLIKIIKFIQNIHWRQSGSGVNSAGARRGFSGILLQNT